jgi:integrase
MTDQGVILHITPTPDRALSRASVKFIGASRSPNTLRAYRSDFADFQEWAGTWQLASLPATPETVSGYLSWLASTGEVTAATIDRRASAISEAHKLSHLPSPTSDETVRKTLAGIRRVLGTAPRFQKTALATDDLRAMLDHMELDTLSGLRDRAILLLGFAGGFRRSELVALDVDDLEETAQGLRVRIRRSKTDQEGVGREVGIPFGRHVDTCPVKAWRAWQSAACLLKGPCFRPMNSRGGVRDRRPPMPGTASDQGWLLRRRLVARLSARSWTRPATRACRWCVGTSDGGHSSRTTRRVIPTSRVAWRRAIPSPPPPSLGSLLWAVGSHASPGGGTLSGSYRYSSARYELRLKSAQPPAMISILSIDRGYW